MTQHARTSVALSTAAIASAMFGWGAFAAAIVLGDHFNNPDPRSGLFLLLWAVLGLVALGTWIGAVVTALRAREVNLQEARTATTLALLTPATWVVEFVCASLWFGYEALSGPLLQ